MPGDIWSELNARMELLRQWREEQRSPEVAERKQQERARIYSSRVGALDKPVERTTFLGFHRARQRYGIPLGSVVELHPLEQCVPVPGCPEFVRGVAPWRGRILSLIDLGRLLSEAETGLADLHVFVVVEHRDKQVGLIGTHIDDIVTVPVSELRAPPVSDDGRFGEWVKGVHDGSRLIVDVEKMLESEQLVAWRHSHE